MVVLLFDVFMKYRFWSEGKKLNFHFYQATYFTSSFQTIVKWFEIYVRTKKSILVQFFFHPDFANELCDLSEKMDSMTRIMYKWIAAESEL